MGRQGVDSRASLPRPPVAGAVALVRRLTTANSLAITWHAAKYWHSIVESVHTQMANGTIKRTVIVFSDTFENVRYL